MVIPATEVSFANATVTLGSPMTASLFCTIVVSWACVSVELTSSERPAASTAKRRLEMQCMLQPSTKTPISIIRKAGPTRANSTDEMARSSRVKRSRLADTDHLAVGHGLRQGEEIGMERRDPRSRRRERVGDGRRVVGGAVAAAIRRRAAARTGFGHVHVVAGRGGRPGGVDDRGHVRFARAPLNQILRACLHGGVHGQLGAG